MSASSELPSIQEALDGNISNCSESYLEHGVEEEDADEEEDMDFNPFLKDSPSVEASSSLSSDIEVLDEDVSSQLQECTRENAEFGEETVMQICEKESDILNSNVARDADGSRNCVIDADLEDAISKRTRARYSLASFTLDELETFLQETDDEDDLHNIDDEEEYKKFLAAVLQGGDDNSMIREDDENVEDEDEENDADFELELEEALESDLEENCGHGIHEEGGVSRRPETRLNRRKKAPDNQSKRVLGQAKRPLRPLLPNTPIASFPTLIPRSVPRSLSTPVHHNYSYGFTTQQLVQLHCLIHEHVQLLIQSYSLCVLDPSKKHIASQLKELILAADKKREIVISQKRAQYPFFCPSSLYTPSPVPFEHTQSSTVPCGHYSDSSQSDQREALSGINSRPPHGTNRQDSFFQTPDSALQVPLVNGSILSVLDVAPLTLAGKYLDEVSIAVQECHRQSIEFGSVAESTKEPLFPFDNSQTLEEDDAEVTRGSTEVAPTKRTLAAVLVEKTKKQSLALVPKQIAGLARRFLSLFNPALFPHLPPPVSVVNRVLFTDAEDELLASGLMEYNSDWKAIQQCYLPCKSERQIFVRQKNRSSSNAPDNPIKAVKKMKASPLSGEEISRIEEGLKVFKLDWMSVWKYMVPHRDPSLLPRQWRIATGTQKSYKTSDDKKMRRRLYEFERRRRKTLGLSCSKTSSQKKEGWKTGNGGESNSGDDCIGREEEAYVHEAFLADWRPETSVPNSPSLPLTNLMEEHRPPCNLLPYSSHVSEQVKSSGQTYPHLSASGTATKQGRAQLGPWKGRGHRKTNARVVKLAPNLPPVNLPASVRVISQSAFRSYNTGKEVSVKSSVKRTKSSQHPGESHVPGPIVHPVVSHVPGAKCVAGDKNQSDLQMHPLLFQASGDRNLPYHPLSCGNSNSSSFNFFPHFQPQLNLSLLCNPHLENQAAKCFEKSSNDTTSAIGIDFHPLLQRSDDVVSDSVTAHQLPQLPSDSDIYRGSFSQLLTAPLVENSFPGNLAKSFNVNEKANEVDLDIHLSLSRSEFATGNRDVRQPCEEPSSALFPNGIANNLDSTVPPLALSGNGISLCGIYVGDQSLPGIVMEQEELSDSEEEIGEHVEFECEEMDDSEGDGGSDSEEIKGLSNSKETAGTSSGKQIISDALSLNLSSFQKNDSKETNVGVTGIKHPIEKHNPPSRPSRSCKKPPTYQNHLSGITQSEEEIGPALDLLALNPSKRSRRSIRRSNASSSKEG